MAPCRVYTGHAKLEKSWNLKSKFQGLEKSLNFFVCVRSHEKVMELCEKDI